jgi:predicted AlkP superfamily pyrophosphatase or phosphodiesterase
MRAVISSVFPPTTTAATMSLETGLSPIEHAWLGWSLYFGELDANVSIFPNTLSGSDGKPAAEYNVARRYIPQKSIFDKITEATNGEVKAVSVSPFSSYQIKSSKEICDTVISLCKEDGRKYIYTYWNQPDYDMHDYGTTPERITAAVKQFNDEVEEMCSSLSDTLVIVTADHGLVDTEWRIIKDHPDIDEC